MTFPRDHIPEHEHELRARIEELEACALKLRDVLRDTLSWYDVAGPVTIKGTASSALAAAAKVLGDDDGQRPS